MHGNGDGDVRALFQPQEIDMDRPVGDRIDLDLARDDAGFLAADVEHIERREHGAGGVVLGEAALLDLHGLGLARAAIDDARG